MSAREVDRAADELYGLPLDEFVPRRDELARELRAAGRRDAAEQVKRMPKPTAPAWVVNRLARVRPDEVRDLLEAGADLRRVQEWLLRREADPADLRAAVEAERSAVGRLVHAGAELLTAMGRAPRGDVLERIGETLHAAAADPAVRDDVERGRLVRDLAAVGLGPAPGSAAAPAGATRRSARRARPEPEAAAPDVDSPAEEARPRAARRPGSGAEAARKQANDAAREAVRDAEAEAKAADRMRVAADRAVARATRALESAEAHWEQAGHELRSARDELAAAEKAAAAAREAAAAAEAELADRRRGIEGDS